GSGSRLSGGRHLTMLVMKTSSRRQQLDPRTFPTTEPARPKTESPPRPPVQEAAGERTSVVCRVRSRPLTDEDHLGRGVALPGHGLGATHVEPASRAVADLGRDGLERRPALGVGHAPLPPEPPTCSRARYGRAPRADACSTQFRSRRISAISTAFVAAPLRRLSETTHSARPRSPGIDSSRRTRPTKISSCPAALVASGYSWAPGSSWTTTPLTAAKSSRARSGVIGSRVSTWTASEWLTNTGMRTAVQEMRSSGRPRILRSSETTFHSSLV